MLGQYQRSSTDLLTPPPSAPNGLSTVSHEYLKGSYGLDLEAVRGGASNLPHLTRTLATSCRRLHRYLGHPAPCAPPLPHTCPLPPACYADVLTSGSVQRACCCLLTFPHLNPCILMVAAETPTHSAPFPCTWVRVGSSDLVSP